MEHASLSRQELDQPVIKKLALHYEERLAMLRVKNDNPKLGDVETAVLRAQIHECKAFQRMLQGKPEFESPVPVRKPGNNLGY